jgi:hypothetical protein
MFVFFLGDYESVFYNKDKNESHNITIQPTTSTTNVLVENKTVDNDETKRMQLEEEERNNQRESDNNDTQQEQEELSNDQNLNKSNENAQEESQTQTSSSINKNNKTDEVKDDKDKDNKEPEPGVLSSSPNFNNINTSSYSNQVDDNVMEIKGIRYVYNLFYYFNYEYILMYNIIFVLF